MEQKLMDKLIRTNLWNLVRVALVIMLSVLLWVPSASAKPDGDVKEMIRGGQAKGSIVFLKRGMISIELSPTEEGIFIIDEEVELSHVQDLAELKQGDEVKVQYEEFYTDDMREGRLFNKRVVTKISLVRRASNALRSGD